MNIKKKLEQLDSIRDEIYKYFGFKQWSYELENKLEKYWFISGDTIHYSYEPFEDGPDVEGTYQETIINNKVIRVGNYVAIAAHVCTGETYLMVFDRKKEHLVNE